MSDPILEFDQFLDRLAVGSSTSHSRDDHPLERSTRWLHRTAPKPNPDPEFARSLRESLLAVDTASVRFSGEEASVHLTRAPLSLPLNRKWVYAEVAALLLLLLPAMWLLTRPDSSPDSVRHGSGNASIDAPGGIIAAVPTATTTPVVFDTIILPTQPGSLGEIIGPPTETVEVRFSDSILFTEGELASTTYRTELRAQPSATASVIATLPTGAMLYVSGFQWRSEEGGTWIPVIDAQTRAAGWVAAAWLQTPNIDGRLLSKGDLAETTRATTLYSLQFVTSEVQAELDPSHPLIVILSTIESEGRDWMQVIDPASKQIGWVVAGDLLLVDLTPGAPAVAVTSVPTVSVAGTPEASTGSDFSQNAIVNPVENVSLRYEGSVSSPAKTLIPEGSQLLVTGPEVDDAGVRWVPVQIVPAGEQGWVERSILREAADVDLLYPIGTSVVAMVDVQLREWLPGEMRTIAVWPREAGTTLTVVGASERRDGTTWLPVDDPSSEARGWVWAELLALPGETDLPAVATGAIVTSVDSLELRESHDHASTVASSTTGGEALRVTDQWSSPDGELWLSVEREDTGDTGWITAESVRNSIVASSFAPPSGTRLRVMTASRMTEKITMAEGDSVTPLDRDTVVVFEGQADIFNVLWLRVRVGGRQLGWLSANVLVAESTESSATSNAIDPALDASRSNFPIVADLPLVLDSVVVDVGSGGASIYETPTQASLIVDTASPGAAFEILGGVTEIDGHVWILVSIPEGDRTGWIDAGMPSSRPYLMPVSILTRLDVYLRTTPNAGQNDIRRLPTGSSFKPFGASVAADGITWIPVLDQLTGQIGWIGSVAGSPLDWPVGTEMATTIEGLSLRTAASLESDIVTVLGRGTTLTLLTQPVEHGGEGWLHVRDNTGNEGWILVTDSGPPY